MESWPLAAVKLGGAQASRRTLLARRIWRRVETSWRVVRHGVREGSVAAHRPANVEASLLRAGAGASPACEKSSQLIVSWHFWR